MQPREIRHHFTLAAPITRVWPLVGTGTGLARWMGAEVTLEPRPGGRFHQMSTRDGDPLVLEGHVLHHTRLCGLVVSCRLAATPDEAWPVYTVVHIDLDATDSTTTVTITHDGFENLPDRYQLRMLARFQDAWEQQIARLRELVEGDPQD